MYDVVLARLCFRSVVIVIGRDFFRVFERATSASVPHPRELKSRRLQSPFERVEDVSVGDAATRSFFFDTAT